jgi:hypothetical protein
VGLIPQAEADIQIGSSHVARPDDLLVNLRDAQGNDLGLTSGDTITIDGKVGGRAISTVNFFRFRNFNLQDLADAFKMHLELTIQKELK